MSKNIYNSAPSSCKNIYNESRILAKNVKYNNSMSGLTGINVQQAIDELALGGGGGGGVNQVTTVGTSSQSILVSSPDSGPIVELKGITGANQNAHVTVTTNGNNLDLDVDFMGKRLVAGVMGGGITYGRNDAGINRLVLGYNSNTSYSGDNFVIIGNDLSKAINGKNTLINIGQNNNTSIPNLVNNNEDQSILIGCNMRQFGGNHYDLLFGHRILRDNPNNSLITHRNIIFANECFQTNTGIVNDNLVLGGDIFNRTGHNNTNIDHNIIIGNIIHASNTNPIQGNIIIGNNVEANPTKSFIVHRNQNLSTPFTASSNNMFYFGNGTHQNTESDEFVLSNGYKDYRILDIPSQIDSNLYFNYKTNYGPLNYPGDPFWTTSDPHLEMKRLDFSVNNNPEVIFSQPLAPAVNNLIGDYAFITQVNAFKTITLSGVFNVFLTGYISNNTGAYTNFKIDILKSDGTTLNICTSPDFGSVPTSIGVINMSATVTTYVMQPGEALIFRMYVYTPTLSHTFTSYFDGQTHYPYITTTIVPPVSETDYLLHYDSANGAITKKFPKNTGSGSKALKNADTGLKFRTFTGTSGIIVDQLTDEINIAFDTGLLALAMEPNVLGLGYGKQDQGILFTGLGRELVPKDRSISLFNQSGSGDIQNYNGTDNILINNIDNQNSNTNALMSNIITNNCVTEDCTFDHSIVLASELDMGGISAETCTLIGNFKDHVIGNCKEAMYICNNVGPGNLNLNGIQSLYLGNATYPETVNDRDAYISGYDRFFLRTPQNATQSYQLYYEPTSSEVTWDLTPAAYNLPIKLPTTLGGSYGLNFVASGTEMTGRNSFNNYASGVNVSGITSVGNNNFTLNTSTTFSDSMIFGNTVRFNSLLNMTNSLIASNILNNTGVTSIANDLIIMPKASSLTVAPGVTSLIGSTFLTSSDISLTTDPNYSVVVASASTVNPGANNMILISGGSNSIVTMQGTGNMLFQASNATTNYTSANFNNGVIFNSGSTTVAATSNSQFNACHSTLRMPNLLTIGTNVNSNNVRLMGFDTTTGLISPYLTSTFSRVYRQQANTNAAGSVTFNTVGVVANIAGTTYHAQVINASLTTAFTCQTTSVTVNTVTIQVFQSTNDVLGGQTMIPAPANIVVSFSMNY